VAVGTEEEEGKNYDGEVGGVGGRSFSFRNVK